MLKHIEPLESFIIGFTSSEYADIDIQCWKGDAEHLYVVRNLEPETLWVRWRSSFRSRRTRQASSQTLKEGGYAIDQDPLYSVRRGFRFRCATTGEITSNGTQQIRELGITTIFDLRSSNEIEKGQKISHRPRTFRALREYACLFSMANTQPSRR